MGDYGSAIFGMVFCFKDAYPVTCHAVNNQADVELQWWILTLEMQMGHDEHQFHDVDHIIRYINPMGLNGSVVSHSVKLA